LSAVPHLPGIIVLFWFFSVVFHAAWGHQKLASKDCLRISTLCGLSSWSCLHCDTSIVAIIMNIASTNKHVYVPFSAFENQIESDWRGKYSWNMLNSDSEKWEQIIPGSTNLATRRRSDTEHSVQRQLWGQNRIIGQSKNATTKNTNKPWDTRMGTLLSESKWLLPATFRVISTPK
jgi:hypothetical protein